MVYKLNRTQLSLYREAIGEIERLYTAWYTKNYADQSPNNEILMEREATLCARIDPVIGDIFLNHLYNNRDDIVKLICDRFIVEEKKYVIRLLNQYRKTADEYTREVNIRCNKTEECDPDHIINIKYFVCADIKCIMQDYYNYLDNTIKNITDNKISVEGRVKEMTFYHFLEIAETVKIGCERFSRAIVNYLKLPDAPVKRTSNRRKYILIIVGIIVIAVILVLIFLGIKYLSSEVFGYDITHDKNKFVWPNYTKN